MRGGTDEAWIVPGRWSAAFALAVLLHLPVLRMAAVTLVERAQWLSGPGRGVGSEVVSVYDLYLVPPRASAKPVSQIEGAAVETPAKAAATTAATTAATSMSASAPVVRESGGGGHDHYYARLRAHLQRHRQALQAEAGGARKVVVRFRVDGSGAVSAIGLQRSSGDARLDAEALDLVRRSAPVPAPPRQVAMSLVVPIEFE